MEEIDTPLVYSTMHHYLQHPQLYFALDPVAFLFRSIGALLVLCPRIASFLFRSVSSAVALSLIQQSLLEVDFLPMVMAAKFQITFFFLSQVMTRGLLLHVSVEIVLTEDA